MVFDTQACSNSVCALEARRINDKKYVGMAVFDENKRSMQCVQYVDTDHMNITEAILLQMRCTTVYARLPFPGDEKKVKNLCSGCGSQIIITGEKNEFDGTAAERDLPRLLKEDIRNFVNLTKEVHAMRAVGALIKNYNLMSQEDLYGMLTFSEYPVSSFVRLDKATFNALNLLPSTAEGVRSCTSILGLLNRTRSLIGARKLSFWVTQPLVNKEEITARHDMVEMLVNHGEMITQLQSALKHVPDVERIAAKFHKTAQGPQKVKAKAAPTEVGTGCAKLEDAHSIYKAVQAATKLHKETLHPFEGMHAETLRKKYAGPLTDILHKFQGLIALIESTVDLEEAEKGQYVMKKEFDPEFQRLAKEKIEIRDGLDQEVHNLEKYYGLTSGNIKLIEVPVNLDTIWAFRVVKRLQNTIHSKGGDCRTISIKKNEFTFSNKKLDTLGKSLKVAEKAYEAKQEVLVKKCLECVATYATMMESFATIMASLDVLCAYAVVSAGSQTQYVRPQFGDTELIIDGGVHPLVVETGKNYVPNNVYMSKKDSRLQLITGPNMGGKSTYLRQVATCCLLNQIGMFVPADRAVLPIVSSIMCRVGANDVQLKGISTFMAEMIEAACILNTADENALVIVDELGRGTSTEDGFGIAWSVARYLVESCRCYTLFATHFHELGALEEEMVPHGGGVINKHATAHVDPNTNQLTFLYEMKDGVADRSYGVYVARLAKFPSSAIDLAQKTATLLEEKQHEKDVTDGKIGDKRPRTNDHNLNESIKRARIDEEIFKTFQCNSKDDFFNKNIFTEKSKETCNLIAEKLIELFKK